MTNTSRPPLLTAAELAAAGRKPPFPFALELADGGQLELSRLLRVLPGQRIVGEGEWAGQRVLAKIFIAAASARHWQRERDGAAALAATGIPTPAVLAAGKLTGQGHYLLTTFLPGARSLADIKPLENNEHHRHLIDACQLIGQLHAHGLEHDDLHPGNFLLTPDGGPWLIDGDAVRRLPAAPDTNSEAPLANLALFFAQFPLSIEALSAPLLAAYRAGRRQDVNTAAFATLLARARQRRIDDFLCKTLRPCTLFDVRRNGSRFSAVWRADADWLAPLLDDPDRALAAGVLLKDGNSATVARIDMGERTVVIKRYNIKNRAHALARCWRPSRAWHAWRAAHRLTQLGIATPLPLALIEERHFGLMRGRAWLVTAWQPGQNLAEWLAPHIDTGPPDEADALLRLCQTLCAQRISHGDLKASNLLQDEGRIVLIDLDAMTQHRDPRAHARAWQRDRARLLANWAADSPLHRWLDARLPA
jgi:tRNA A-37 threonylcarbamoyl transferase component Bud32